MRAHAQSTTPSSPPIARRQELANAAAAYAMDSVADPLPACSHAMRDRLQTDADHLQMEA